MTKTRLVTGTLLKAALKKAATDRAIKHASTIKTTKIQLALLLPLLSTLTFLPAQTAAAQAACTSQNGCAQQSFCMGTNSGRFDFWSAEKPFLDLSKGASVAVRGYSPDTIVENRSIALDANKYPTITNRNISILFFGNSTATTTRSQLPSGKYIAMWDGQPNNISVHGPGISGVRISSNRAEFNLDSSKVGNAYMVYRNQGGRAHATNIRIVPQRYEGAYRNWNWSNFRVGSTSNPPIFFPEWIEKMKRSCIIRYVNARHIVDPDAVRLNRGSSARRIKPAYSAWYVGYGLGNGVDKAHIWPWELIVEASRQTGAKPWINFTTKSWEFLKRGDSYIRDIAQLFRSGWGGPVYLEYSNEIWNGGYIFKEATDHVRLGGPGTRNDVNENYARRASDVIKAFSDSYDSNGCNSIGVLASQGRGPHRGREVLRFADMNYIDVISPAVYVGKDMTPGSPVWNYVSNLYYQTERGRSQWQVFEELKTEILTGSRGIVQWNWRNDVSKFMQEYLDMAKENNICTAFYEGGLHMRVDRFNRNNAGQLKIANFMRDYQRSIQQATVEKEVNDWLRAKGGGPHVLYASFLNAGWGTFSYWDSVFETKANESPRAKLIGSYRGRSNSPVPPGINPPDPNPAPNPTPPNPNPTPPNPGAPDVVKCGVPSFNRKGSNQYLIRICSNGAWQVLATGGGVSSTKRYGGKFTSSAQMRHLKKHQLESGDYASVSGSSASFGLNVKLRDADAMTFQTDSNANQCLRLEGGTSILVGKNAVKMSGSFNPATLKPCG